MLEKKGGGHGVEMMEMMIVCSILQYTCLVNVLSYLLTM